jgi:hypothetical protein
VRERPESPDEQGQGDGQHEDDEEETQPSFEHGLIISSAGIRAKLMGKIALQGDAVMKVSRLYLIRSDCIWEH